MRRAAWLVWSTAAALSLVATSCSLVAGLGEIDIVGTGGVGGQAACSNPAQCDDENPCSLDTCSAEGLCEHAALADGPAPDGAQIVGDCKTVHCASGAASTSNDAVDVPNDAEDCTIDTCNDGAASHTAKPEATACIDAHGLPGSCNGDGVCQVQCSDTAPCPDPGPCATVACDAATGTCVVAPLPNGIPTPNVVDMPGDCHRHVCKDGVDFDKVDDSDLPITENDCDFEICSGGVESNPPRPLDSLCSAFGGTFCDDVGACVECNHDDQCSGPDDDCQHPICKNHGCGPAFTADGTPTVAQTKGDCQQVQCDGAGTTKSIADNNDKPVDGKECTSDVCTNGVPSNPTVPLPQTCNGGAYMCTMAGLCGCQNNSDCLPLPNTCGGGGTPLVCGCTPTTCAAALKTCGTISDLCFNPALSCNGAKSGQETDVDCGGPTAACATRCAQGKVCGATSDCAAGLSCVDGVCCNSPCSGACQACTTSKKGSGSDGVCGPIPVNQDPDNECAIQTSSTCGTTGACDGAGACSKHPAGTVCVALSCVAGVLASADTCNGSGTCVDAGTVSCGLYSCNAGGTACRVSCSTNGHCAGTAYCNGNVCAPKKGNGAVCAAPNECMSASCVDGVCCDLSCNGTCVACSAAKKGSGADGACGNIAAGLDPDNECNGAPTCNGSGVCM